MKETDLMVEALQKGEHEVRFYSLLPEFAVRGCAKKALQIALQGNGSFSVFRDHLVSQYSVLFHFDAPRPTPANPRRHVHLAPIEEAAPVPTPNPRPVEEDSIAIVRARPLDTFKNLVKEFHITSTPRFFVPCSDPSSMARGLNASFPSFLESEEGVFSVQMSSGTHEGKIGLFVTFPLTMPCSQFLDHRKKGEEKADLADEICDVFWVLLAIANQTGVNLTEAFEKNLAIDGDELANLRYERFRKFGNNE